MNIEQTKEAIKVMQAYVDGKEIQVKRLDEDWTDYPSGDTPSWDWSMLQYRIKPQPMYRSFNNAEECFNEMKKHEPFGWVNLQDGREKAFILSVEEIGFRTKDKSCFYNASVNIVTFADGTPFGIKME